MTGGASGSGGAASGGSAPTGGTGGIYLEATGGVMNTGGTAATGGSGAGGSGAGGGTTGRCGLAVNASSAKALEAYATFKEVTVTSDGAGDYLRVFKPDSGSEIGSTVSEGMGYGLLLAVYNDDQAVFDRLWQYTAKYLNGNGLMDWEIRSDGTVLKTGAASDGDEDIAFALIMADRRWGGQGSLDESYLTLGVRMVEAMWDHEVDIGRDYMWWPGDSWGGDDVTNISYFAPAYFRVFGEVTDNVEGWNAVIDGNYAILERTLNAALGNADNGLVPAWSNSQGQPVEAYIGAPMHFQNDSTRTPFRLGQDWCWFGEPRAKAYLDKIASFYASEGVANIVDGYNLDGTPHPERPERSEQAASFVGPAGVAFMSDPMWQPELNEAWDLVATETLTNGTIYYQKSWTALSLLMMAGDMVVYPAP